MVLLRKLRSAASIVRRDPKRFITLLARNVRRGSRRALDEATGGSDAAAPPPAGGGARETLGVSPAAPPPTAAARTRDAMAAWIRAEVARQRLEIIP